MAIAAGQEPTAVAWYGWNCEPAAAASPVANISPASAQTLDHFPQRATLAT
jgi:hypothetical protein